MAPAAKKRKVKSSADDLFKHAYYLYRCNLNGQALVEIGKADENEVRFMEIKAQLLYRMERCEEAKEIFERLLATHSDEFDDLRKANLIAVQALLDAKNSKEKSEEVVVSRCDADPTFEQMYNTACRLIYQSKFDAAIKLLDEAAVKCRESLTEEGLTEEEIQKDLSTILAQKAYALENAGQVEEALKIYKAIQDGQVATNPNVMAVTNNNVLVHKQPLTTADALKKARYQLSSILKTKRSKLIQLQREKIVKNLGIVKSTTLEKKEGAFQEIVTGKLNKRKRKRKPKLPKNYDPNVEPDPERWLPRQERSAYKKRHKKYKDRDIGRGTQGAASSGQTGAAATMMDYSKPASSVEASPKPAEGPRQQRPGAPKKAKKKKGGKW